MPGATVGVYSHVPFCERICPYCDFAVVAARKLGPDQEQRYVDALLRELAVRRAAYPEARLASLYFGGGTPSLLEPRSIQRLVEAAHAAFAPGAAAIETTLEVNPSTVERERLPGFREAGINRVSVGVQSFDDTTLQRLGRAHRAKEAHRTLAACRAAGFAAISVDLIVAAPDQGRAQLEADLNAVVAFGPEHVSTYELTIEPGTPFELAHRRGQLALPAEDEAAALLGAVEARLGDAGYERYEISNYARPGHEAVHNRRYWQRRPVLGLGMGAFSTEPARAGAPFGSRHANPRALDPYLKWVEALPEDGVEALAEDGVEALAEAGVEAGGQAEAGPDEVFDAPTARGEAVFLALRQRAGLVAARFADEFGAPPRSFFAAEIDRLQQTGLLHEAPNGDLRLTARGRLLADTAFAEFV